jgi:hypothetical protein
MSSGPRIIPENSQMKLKPLLKELRLLNPLLANEFDDIDKEMDPCAGDFFRALGIESPLPLQSLCYNFCTS